MSATTHQPLTKDWLFVHSLLLLAATMVDVWLKSYYVTAFTGLLVFAVFIAKNINEYSKLKPLIGWPFLVTTLRLLMVLSAPFLVTKKYFYLLPVILVSLDGLDGFLARKLNQTTAFGGQLDMETDALFCLLFSIIIANTHPDLLWVLVAGSLRYVYKIVTTLLPKKGFQETKKNYARYFAGAYFFSIVLFFILPETMAKMALLAGNVLVLFSFGISFFAFFNFNSTK